MPTPSIRRTVDARRVRWLPVSMEVPVAVMESVDVQMDTAILTVAVSIAQAPVIPKERMPVNATESVLARLDGLESFAMPRPASHVTMKESV